MRDTPGLLRPRRLTGVLLLACPALLSVPESHAQAAQVAARPDPEIEITVQAGSDRGPVRLYTGWLHGFEENDPLPVPKIQALNTSSWRVSKLWQLGAVRQFTSNIQFEVSFSWRWQNLGNPAANLTLWQQYIAARVNYVNSNSLHVEYWDIWNEPDHAYFWRWSYDDLLLAFDSAISTIKAINPNAKIIGPSFAKFVARDNFGGKTVADFVTDLHTRYGVLLEAVAWHMNDEWYPWNIQGHADTLRNAISAIGGGYVPKLVINEYTQSLIVLRPVFLASFIWHMDQAEIDFANLSCWDLYSNCNPPTTYSTCWAGMNGLFLENFSSEQHSYWFYAWHAREQGNRRLEVSHPEINTFAIASRSDLRQEIVICVGKHGHANPNGLVALRIEGIPWMQPTTQVEVSKLAAAHQLCNNDVWKPVQVACPEGPALVSTAQKSVINGTLTVHLPTFADDDFQFVKITPAPGG